MKKIEEDFKVGGGSFEEYGIDDIFISLDGRKKLSKLDLSETGEIPVYSSDSTNNGVCGLTELKADYVVDKKNPIYVVFGDHTRTMNIAEKSFCVMDNVKVLIPRCNNIQALLYVFSVWKKRIPNLGYARHWTVAKEVKLSLPTKNGGIDFSYMESVIRELEEERICELSAYLKVSGLEATELTRQEKDAVLKLQQGKIAWKEFKVGEQFEHLETPYLGKNPRQDNVSRIKTDEYDTPVICAKRGDNGIMYWGRHSDFTTFENVLSVIYNGAVAAGLVYAQKEAVGVFTDSYLIRYKDKNVSFIQNLFLKTVLQKAIYEKYSRDIKAIWNRISENKVNLPVTPSGEIDWKFMQNIISAESRLAVQGVVEWMNASNEKNFQIKNS